MTDTELLDKAIESAKNFENFDDILLAVSLHPEWLTYIPEGRQWAILHQVIFAGDVNNLDQLLALQKSNKNFRLLTNTRDEKTILQIASLRKDVPDMKARIEQLIKLDEMLNYARACEWDRCYNIVKEKPSYVNEKTPYRRYYLIHHMACANAIEQFERFRKIPNCKFDLTLQADRKKVNIIAREEGQPSFAAYIEKEYPFLLEKDDPELADVYKASDVAVKQTQNITTLMEQKCIVKDLDRQLIDKPTVKKSRADVMKHIAVMRSEYEDEQKQKSTATVKAEDDKCQDLILDTLTCPLTLAVFVDPGKYYYLFKDT